MLSRNIGYIKASSSDLDSHKQLEGIKLDKVFTDIDSKDDSNMPQLKALLEFISEGDNIFIQNMDRLSQDLDECTKIVTDFMNCGAKEVYFVESGALVTRSGKVHLPKDPTLSTTRLMRFKKYWEQQFQSSQA